MRSEPAVDAACLLAPIRRLQAKIRQAVVQASEEADAAQSQSLADVAAEESGADTIYAIDKISEEVLVDFFEREIAPAAPMILIAEGIEGGKLALPRGIDESSAKWRIIMDPIDGTRGLMYQKRSAWVLTAVAPNKGGDTSLADVVLAVQTELPLVKQHLSDTLWAVLGQGANAERLNRITGEAKPIRLKPSKSKSIAHGYATVSRFFPGAREELAAIDEEIVLRALGPVQPGKAHCFEDQYASTGGQLYELACGHDRFVCDLRPLMDAKLAQRGLALGLCCHPYDLCTELISRELGVIVTDLAGQPIRARLDVEPDIAWVGYANAAIQRQIGPVLKSILRERGLI